MNRESWATWKKDRSPPSKARRLAKLVALNEGLVQKIVQGFTGRTRYYVAEMREDLLQAGRIGLIRAIHKWDPDRGAFSTVAFNEIRYEIQRTACSATPIDVPRTLVFASNGQREAEAFYARHGRQATAEDLNMPASLFERARMARMEFVSEAGADMPQEVDAEGDLDTVRDLRSLRSFVRKLTKAQRAALESGDEELSAKARAYVEARRVIG
jgi:RNA polymerase sigma factor (sigma-70 family)